MIRTSDVRSAIAKCRETATAVEVERVELDGDIERYLLDRAERANERDGCYRPEVLAALHADGRHPVDANGDDWEPSLKAE